MIEELKQEAKKLISEAKNVSIISSQDNEPESLSACLALFYTLKELNKNVNLVIDNLPPKVKFLTPGADYVFTPQNFVISIPRNIADISQVYYEKNEENLKIHLTTQRGVLKKDDISFYYTQAKPDLVITVGIRDFRKEMENKLDSFGFLLGAPILNIDNNVLENQKFGKINLVFESSISETTQSLVETFQDALAIKNVAECLLTGLVIYYQNFQNQKTNPKVFKTVSILMEKGADYHKILENLNKQN